jgi:S1-C subfamily serine protease
MGSVASVLTLLMFNLALADSKRDIARKAFASTVLLVMTDQNAAPVSQGSGFFVEQNIVVTNIHVVKDAYAGTAQLVGGTL